MTTNEFPHPKAYLNHAISPYSTGTGTRVDAVRQAGGERGRVGRCRADGADRGEPSDPANAW